jgi:hypothetical protein
LRVVVGGRSTVVDDVLKSGTVLPVACFDEVRFVPRRRGEESETDD